VTRRLLVLNKLQTRSIKSTVQDYRWCSCNQQRLLYFPPAWFVAKGNCRLEIRKRGKIGCYCL
jgi:hypothetical protein